MDSLKEYLSQVIAKANEDADTHCDWADKAYFIGMRTAFEDIQAFIDDDED